MKAKLLILFLMVLSISNAQWVKSMGGTSFDIGEDLVIDENENVFVIGEYNGTVDFDDSEGTLNLTSVGESDIFFAKYDANGSIIWAKSIGGIGFDFGYSLALDHYGNILITGYFTETADFDPSEGNLNLTSNGFEDAFFAKYDSQGSLIWVNKIGGVWWDRSYSIKVDKDGNLFLCGEFQEIVDFDPSEQNTNLTSIGNSDTFIAKYDNEGSFLWARNIAARGTDFTIDESGNLFLTGEYFGVVDFDPSDGITNLTSIGDSDIFFAKYDENGSFLWAKSISGIGWGAGRSIAIDNNENLLLTGYYFGTLDFDPSLSEASTTSENNYNIFIAKYDSTGSFEWVKNIGGNSDDIGVAISVDKQGAIYIGGGFTSTADFDPSNGIENLTSNGYYDIFFSKYNSNGSLLWAKSIGGIGDDYIFSMNVNNGFIYLIGNFESTTDFDPSEEILNLNSNGLGDIYIAKYHLSDGLLPVELTSFTAIVESDQIKLEWSTVTETNNFGFEIERSVNSQNPNWEVIGFVEGAGTTIESKKYSFVDNRVTSNEYNYRLKQIDFDGKFDYSQIIAVETFHETSIPTEFKLEQNYPNPFNPTTSIEYSIPNVETLRATSQMQNVSLKVFDILGREVAELVNEQKSAGRYKVNFNASNLSSGVYLYQLKSGNHVSSMKMLLIK